MMHELKSPLNGILGLSKLLSLESGLSAGQLSMLRVIQRCGEHQLALINDLMTLAQLDHQRLGLRMEWLDLQTVVEQSLEMVRTAAEEKGLALCLMVGEETPRRIRTDGLRLRQVLVNLLSNAIKFTSEGSVQLSLRQAPEASRGDTKTLRIHFAVQDTGQGFCPSQGANLGCLFTRLQDSGEQPEGSGVGLTVARELVSLMGGDLSWFSEPGRGSTFSFEIASARSDEEGYVCTGHA